MQLRFITVSFFWGGGGNQETEGGEQTNKKDKQKFKIKTTITNAGGVGGI